MVPPPQRCAQHHFDRYCRVRYYVLMEPFVLNMDVAAGVILRTTVIFLYAFLLLRLLGKRHLSHLMYTDLMVIIAFGSAVGDVMIYGEQVAHLFTSMIAITVVAVIVKILEEVSSHNHTASHLIEGTARLVVEKGAVIPQALEHENLSEDMVLSLLREKGIDSVKDVRKAFFEPDGELSTILYKR